MAVNGEDKDASELNEYFRENSGADRVLQRNNSEAIAQQVKRAFGTSWKIGAGDELIERKQVFKQRAAAWRL